MLETNRDDHDVGTYEVKTNSSHHGQNEHPSTSMTGAGPELVENRFALAMGNLPIEFYCFYFIKGQDLDEWVKSVKTKK